MGLFKKVRDVVVVVVLLLIPFFFLRANLVRVEERSGLDELLLQISAPVQYAARHAAGGVSSVVQEYLWLVDVKRNNDQLVDENARLRRRLRQLTEVSAENRRLRRLMEVRETIQPPGFTAEVVAKEVSPFFRVMRVRLDRGDLDGIQAGMPVVSPNGLVGQVRRVWGRYSDVLLTVDRSSAVDVVVKRSGARGMLRGTGESNRYACRVEYLERGHDVKKGDLLVTSGMGARFPEGLAVGRVARVDRKEFGLYQEVEVTPVVGFSELDEVLVLRHESRRLPAD